MQLKQGLGRTKLDLRQEGDEQSDQKAHGRTLTRSQIKENISKHENAYFKEKTSSARVEQDGQAIAGGPKQGSNTRGTCPKCRSVGIVLARAYGGDDYHSCIYCGYQAYLKNVDPKFGPTLSS